MVRTELGPAYDVETHFTPRYNPWDQRMCLVPNSDLFESIRSGKAEVVTDQIARFTEKGIALESGRELDADIIVTATGLNLVVLGEMQFSVDGAPVDFAKTWTYKGMMYSGVPNLITTFGYINASWTLARRPHRGVRVPAAPPHGRARRAAGDAAAARRGPGDGAAAVDRRILVRLHAEDDAPVPETG
jgi:cation diffusion facilitator CzcD-associated flavoprotein CzcO